MKPNSPLCGPVCSFGDRVGKRHQQSPRPALLGQREPVVNEQGKPNKPKKMIPSPSPFRGRGELVLGEEKQTRPCEHPCAVLEAR